MLWAGMATWHHDIGQQRGEPPYYNPCPAYIIKYQKTEAKKPLRGFKHVFCRKDGFIRALHVLDIIFIPRSPRDCKLIT
jgi:hypothetical protein